MSRTVLSISWLNGQVKAVHVRGAKLVSSWVWTELAERAEDVRRFLPLAVEATGYRGREVVFVVENRNLLYHLQEAPIGRRSLVRSFIERRVEQGRFFEEEPTCYGMSSPVATKSNQRFLLTLLPRYWILDIREACLDQRLSLKAIFAPATVLTRQIQKLTGNSPKATLVAADLGGAVTLVVGRRDQVWFARSVVLSAPGSSPSGEAPKAGASLRVVKPVHRTTDRLEQELNRTRLFSQQQFETSLEEVWVLGGLAQGDLENLKMPVGLSLRSTPVAEEAFLFAWEASQIPASTPGNLLGQLHRQAVNQRRAAAWAVAAALVISLLANWWIPRLARERERELQTIQAQLEESRQQHDEILRGWKDARAKQAFVGAVGTTDDPSIPYLFLRYLGQQLPDAFVLGRVDLNRSTNRWHFRLDGRHQSAGDDLLLVLENFERQLTNSHFKALISSSTRTRLFQENPGEVRPPTSTAYLSEGEKPFFVEGVIP